MNLFLSGKLASFMSCMLQLASEDSIEDRVISQSHLFSETIGLCIPARLES